MAPVKDYTPEQMGLAIDAVRKGLKVAEAAKKFGVPRITLYNKTTGKSPLVCTMGPSTILSKEDENIIEIWIKDMAERHIPITKEELLDSVQRLITEKNMSNPFTDNRPGKKWYTSFLKRHPDITERTAQNLTTARDNVSEEQLKGWFNEVKTYLQQKNLLDILEKPERIYNTDESAFFLNPKPGRVLAKKGDKHIYSSSGDEKDNLTVLVTGNAAGQLAPTMVVFNYERVPSSISSSFPDDWVIGRSETGWMRGSTFFEYMSNNFDKWLTEQKVERPILFFLDGHKSHLTLHLSNFCVANGIEIISLYPNSTHLLQPMDLAVFRPLKNSWRKAVQSWKMQNLGQNLKKEHFAPVLKTALTKLTGDSIKHGFRAGGLLPYGPDYVDMSKIKTQKRHPLDHITGNKFHQTLETKIVSTFSQEKINLFRELYYKKRSELEISLPEEDVSLYVIWAHSLSQEAFDECDTLAPHASIHGPNDPGVNQIKSPSIVEHALGENISSATVDEEIFRKEDNIDSILLSRDVSKELQDLPCQSSRKEDNTNSILLSPDVSKELKDLHCPQNDNQTKQDLRIDNPNIPNANLENLENSQSHCNDELDAVDIASNIAPVISQKSFEYVAGCIQDKTPKKALETSRSASDTVPINPDNISSNIIAVPGPSHTQRNVTAPIVVQSKDQLIIPSPFKRVLFWPGEEESTKGKKRKIKEKLPCAVTGQAWREYHKRKEEEKRVQLEEKEKRSRERQEKRILKETLKEENKKKRINKKKKVVTKKTTQDDSASSETEEEVHYAESDDSYNLENDEEPRNSDSDSENTPLIKMSDAPIKLLKGSYVIVIYEGEYFPGLIENVNNDRFKISTMTFSSGNTYKWPEKKDILWYNKKNIVQHISPPVLVNKRGFYSVKEMQKYSNFTT